MRLDDPKVIAHPYRTFVTMRAHAPLQWVDDPQMFIALWDASGGCGRNPDLAIDDYQ